MMFISKFNTLIRNRAVWGAFAFLVVIAFVGWGTHSGGRQSDSPLIGKIGKQAISAEEFQEAWMDAYLATYLMVGRSFSNVTPEMDHALKTIAWQRLASIRHAKTLGLAVADDEAASVIKQQSIFQKDGQFDPALYETFINNFLSGTGFTSTQFTRYLKNEILLNKIRHAIAAQIWISPKETENLFHQLYDEIVVSYALLKPANLNYAVDVTDEEARDYFAENQSAFQIPEKIRVKYVEFPFSDYLTEHTPDEDVLQEYYEDHIEEFSTLNENELLTPEPFEEARGKVLDAMRQAQAELTAAEQAAEFEIILAPDRQGNALTFEEAADKEKLTVKLTGYFANHEILPEVEAGENFSQTAFTLRNTPEDYFSRPLRGSKGFYILAFDERKDSYLPTFEEVKREVFRAARADAMADELKRLAVEIHTKAMAATESPEALEKALAGFGIELQTTEPFALQTGIDDISELEPEFPEILREVLTCKSGELTGLLSIEGGYAIGYLASRKPAPSSLLPAISAELTSQIHRMREEMMFDEWQNFLLAKAEMHNLQPIPADPELADIDDDDI